MDHRDKAQFGMQHNMIRVPDTLNSSDNPYMVDNSSRHNPSQPQVLMVTLPTHIRRQLSPLPCIVSLYKECISKHKQQVLQRVLHKVNQHSNTSLASKTQ